MHLHEYNGYKLAVLKKNHKWYLEYSVINPEGEWQRFRPSFGVNRIKNLRERELKIRRIQADINDKLPKGFPFKKIKKKKKKKKKALESMTLKEGIERAVLIKKTSSNGEHHIYDTKSKIFLEWCDENNLLTIQVSKFKKRQAAKFLNYTLVNRKIANVTYNNYLIHIKGFFTELLKMKLIKKNPFDGIKSKKVGAKRRTALSKYQKKVVVNYCRRNQPMLFLGILLQYYCFIRPIELCRLRIGHIDFDNGQIILPGNKTKNSKQQPITLPDIAIPLMKEIDIWNKPPHFYVFGKGVKPHESIPCHKGSLNEKHRVQVLQRLLASNKLASIEGLSFYSWKDTGAYELVLQKVNILEIQKQLRHSSLAMTEKYLSTLYSVNKEVKALHNVLV